MSVRELKKVKPEDIINRVYSQKEETAKTTEEIREAKREGFKYIKRNREQEAKLFKKFKEIIKDEHYFRFEHFEKIGVPYELLIHLSAKNAGKTTEIMRLIKKTIDKGERFMYGRVHGYELAGEMINFETREDSPVRAVEYKNTWYFFKKSEINRYIDEKSEKDENGILNAPAITFRNLRKFGLTEVGRGYTFLKSNCLSGGLYEGYTTIIFDEILSYDPVNRISKKVLDAWDASFNTIQRNKERLNVYLLGNLQDVPEHPLLNYYGIDVDDNLRYIELSKSCRLLYINSGGLYKNTIGHKKGVSQQASIERSAFLAGNKVVKPHPNILNPGLFENMEDDYAFVFYLFDGPYLFWMKKLQSSDKLINCLDIQPLTFTTVLPSGKVYTNDLRAININEKLTYRLTLESYLRIMRRLFRYRRLYFSNNATYVKLQEFIRDTDFIDNQAMEWIV